jgi:hypothetical protein
MFPVYILICLGGILRKEKSMKNINMTGFFTCILLVPILIACQIPASVTPPNQEPASPANVRPFSATIILRGGGAGPGNSRAIAGPSKSQTQDIFNFVQVIVLDEAKEIVDLVEGRRNGNGSYEEQFIVDIPYFGKSYHFLMLAGYLEEGSEQPTLLASGSTTKKIDTPETLTMILWPLIIDVKFTHTKISGTLHKEPDPAVPVSLFPAAWSVQWTVQTDTGGNGFGELLKAQTNTGAEQLFKNKKPVVVGSAAAGSLTVTGNLVTLDITDTTQGIPAIGTEAAINFNLEYVPFYQITAAKWTRFNDKSAVFDLNGEADALPVWIIRNGLNDLARNADTDFALDAGNGNGAISFVVEANSGLLLEDGKVASSGKIDFTTKAYEDKADLYYAVVNKGNEPQRSDYTILGQYEKGTHKDVSVPGFSGGKEVYLVSVHGVVNF